MGHNDGTLTNSQAMGQNHLLRRGSSYFFRRRVPQDLRGIIGKKEIKKALGTSDPKEAKRRATIETLRTDELFQSKREQVQHVAPPHARLACDYRQAIVLVMKWYRELEESSDDWLEANLDIFQKPDELREALETCHLDEHVFSGGGDWGLGRRYQGESGKRKLLEILAEHRVEFAGTDQELKRLAALVRKGYLENAKNDIRRLNCEPIQDTSQNSRHRTETNLWENVFHTAPPISRTPEYPATVGDVLTDFMQEQTSKGRAGATLRTYAVPIRFLRETLGESTLLASVTRDRMKEIRALILTLPANAKKGFPDKSLLETIELAKAAGRRPIERKTADNYFRNIQAIFNYATRIRKIPFNPIADELFRGGSRRSRKPRSLFDIQQLNSLFSSPAYLERKGIGNRQGRFWVPILALFQGTRLNETCQLYTEDVFEKDGVWCIRIDDTRIDGSECEKKLKTATSRRTIPVHPTLLKIGFQTFVELRRSDRECPRLFPDLPLGQTGYYSDPFQKWFGRLLVQVLGEKPLATFHSFRHMWKDALTEAHVSDGIAKRLGGWSSDSSAAAGYGQGPKPQTLLKGLAKVEFPGLILDHLYRP